jgi:heme-degrading monooxygenase HmoA
MIARTPEPPYYAVIFSATQTHDLDGYGEMAEAMVRLAVQQPGFLGIEHARDGLGITVSYWADEAAIIAWKANTQHQLAQRFGREKWYSAFAIRVARVERAYGLDPQA